MKLTSLLGIIAAVLLFWITFPGGGGKEAARRTVCLSNTKQQALALEMYREGTDGRFPDRDHWMDAIEPFVKDSKYVLHVPGPWRANAPGVYGYAFNSTLSRTAQPKDPEKVAIVYDSSNPIRNASDPETSLPNPGRHDGKNHIACVDGHAKAVEMK